MQSKSEGIDRQSEGGEETRPDLLESSKLLPNYFERGPVLWFFTVNSSNRSQSCNSGRASKCWLSPSALPGYPGITVNISQLTQSCKAITVKISQIIKPNHLIIFELHSMWSSVHFLGLSATMCFPFCSGVTRGWVLLGFPISASPIVRAARFGGAWNRNWGELWASCLGVLEESCVWGVLGLRCPNRKDFKNLFMPLFLRKGCFPGDFQER